MIVLRKNARNDKYSITAKQGEVQPLVSRVGMSVGQMEVGIRECEDEPMKARKQVFDMHGDGLNEKTVGDLGANLEDEVKPPSDRTVSMKEIMLITVILSILSIGGALIGLRPTSKIPWAAFNLAVTTSIVLTITRYTYGVMMRPVLQPFVREGSRPAERVRRMADESFHFIYYFIMVLAGWALFSRQTWFPRFLGGTGDILNTTKNWPNV